MIRVNVIIPSVSLWLGSLSGDDKILRAFGKRGRLPELREGTLAPEWMLSSILPAADRSVSLSPGSHSRDDNIPREQGDFSTFAKRRKSEWLNELMKWNTYNKLLTDIGEVLKNARRKAGRAVNTVGVLLLKWVKNR